MASNTTLCANAVSTNELNVVGTTTLNSLALHDAVQAVSVPVAAAAATASRILPSSTIVTLTPTVDADDRAYLPNPANVPMGKVFIIQTTATGCELSSEGDGTTATTINGTAVTDAAGVYDKELALAASSTFFAIKTGNNAYTVTPGAATPDA